MKKLLLIPSLFTALSFSAAAQTTSNVVGLDLIGSVAKPIIKNHSGKAVLWLSFKRLAANDVTGPSEGGQWFVDQAGGLPDGASVELQRYNSKTKVVVSAAITAAIFADGEFRGSVATSPFQHSVERDFQLTREVWQMAQAGEWDKVKTRADNMDDGPLPSIAARRLLQARGNSAAMAALAYYGLFPANTWQGTLINKIYRIPLQLIAQWFSPTVVHAQDLCTLPTTCPALDPSTIIFHPQFGYASWYCDDYSGSPDPCPAGTPPVIPNSSPTYGIAAHCIAAGSEMGVQVTLGQDYSPGNMAILVDRLNPAYYSNELRAHGGCGSHNFPGIENYDYRNYCARNKPYQYFDNTGTYCGVSACGYTGSCYP